MSGPTQIRSQQVEEWLAQVRVLESSLFCNPALRCLTPAEDGHRSCVTREIQRPLTPAERRLGWKRRPYEFFHIADFCPVCLAWFHAEMTARSLRLLSILLFQAEQRADEEGG